MEEKSGPSKPALSIVTEEHVRKVLLRDKGNGAQLVSWDLLNFTNVGDNFASSVTSLQVKYSFDGKECDAFYVGKLNPQRRAEVYDKVARDIFLHESEFYLSCLPELNDVMRSIGQPQLNFPQCFYGSLELGKEQLYFEDLRKRNFVMFDKKKSMDVPHATLVLRELARLHAASLLLQARSSEPLELKFKDMLKDLLSEDYVKAMMYPMMEGSLDRSIRMLKSIGGYEKAILWIEGLKTQIEDMFSMFMKSEGYNVICHGDCWNNNVLFRYSSDGCPTEVMLLDLQACRKASLATDLHNFMYTSLTSDVRRPNLNSFLNSYHKAFKKVMEAGGVVMPFTEEDILTEFRAKNKLGAMYAMLSIPIMQIESADIPDMDKTGEGFKEVIDKISAKAEDTLATNTLLKSRFLATFDEFIETGLIQ